MPYGIILFGSSGSLKTTLSRIVARQQDDPNFDISDRSMNILLWQWF